MQQYLSYFVVVSFNSLKHNKVNKLLLLIVGNVDKVESSG